MDPENVKSNLVLILDYGSQYTHLITRRIRSLSVFSLCISGTSSLKSIVDLKPRVIILSGGPHSVHSPNSPSFPDGFVDYVESNGVFVLGICYGLQLLVQRLGGIVRVGERQEYGRMEIEVVRACGLFGSKEVGHKQTVWMSHGDEAAELPEGLRWWRAASRGQWLRLRIGSGGFTAFSIIRRVDAGWNMEDVLNEEIKLIKGMVAPDDHVNLRVIWGYKERERVMETFERDLHLPVTCVDATNQFLSKLKGVVDPEMKRKIIGKEFISSFDAFGQDLEHKFGKKPVYLSKEHCTLIASVPWAWSCSASFGDVTEGNALDILRQVDEIFIQSIKDAGIYDSIWQAFAVFLPIRSVGVQGDQRTHSHVVALRAVTSQDGMTADWYNFEHKFLDDVARKICNSVRGVNRVVQDITSKPPSTIEWE
ncbi:GMP synthase [Vitis vinifera]|uniref:GMP synthase [glutamine-hydrolyzing] n=1 Tax=Vitis vinifera TaxID=29760 RepID=A0A438JJT0_VITVI|nr:GMP synthase [Vitis vinifera]